MKKILVLLGLLAMSVSSATWHLPAQYGGLQDSVWLIIMTQAGGKRDSANMGAGQYFDTTITVSNDSAYYAVFRNWATGEDSAAVWAWGRDVPVASTGPYTYTLVVLDTTATPDSTLASSSVSIYNSAGSHVDSKATNGSGVVSFSLDSGSYTIKFFDPGYAADTIVDTITASETDTLEAYDTHTTSTARLWGTLINSLGDSLYGATVLAWRGECETSTANDQVVSSRQMVASSNTSGYFSLDLIKSDEFDKADCGKYTIEATYAGETLFKTRALNITGTFNISDSISARP